VTADFNGDGFDDLAVGVPNEDVEVGVTCTPNLAIGGVTASGNDGNVPQNVLDNNLGTRWSSLGIGQFITADLGSIQNVCSVHIAWYKGNARQYHLVIATSSDGTTFTNAFSGVSSGTTLNSENYTFPSTNERYVRIIVNGNSVNNWASLTELDILGLSSPSQTISDTGAVNVIYGSSSGLSSTTKPIQIWTQDSPFIQDKGEPNDHFGSALATGDFNNDGISDLAIGVPGQLVNTNFGIVDAAGAVNVIYGSSDGLSSTEISPGDGRINQLWNQLGIFLDNPEPNDHFGSALATGDFNKDGYSDLAIGVPGEDVGTIQTDAGAVNVIYGSLGITIGSGGLSATVPLGGFGRADQLWTQDSPNIEDRSEAADRFGSSLG
jgi:hypothetical protein